MIMLRNAPLLGLQPTNLLEHQMVIQNNMPPLQELTTPLGCPRALRWEIKGLLFLKKTGAFEISPMPATTGGANGQRPSTL